jgi:hypothetical protein
MVDDGEEQNPVDKLFSIEMASTTKNLENDNEPPTIGRETVMKLSVQIDNDNKPIDNIDEGLGLTMKGQLEKFSEML